jgi:hypothetical protein
MLQRDLQQKLRADAAATRDRIAALVRPLDSAKLNEHPESDGWSVGQVLEHLCLADERYEAPVADLLRHTRPDAAAPSREWKPTFIGKLIATSLESSKRIKRGPRAFRPGPTPRAGIVDAFLANERKFAQVMEDATSYDWQGTRLRSPALPWFVPRMNMGDAFRIHVVHVTRHAKQIERLVKQL